ncbi:MAG: Bifunctional protein PyrR [Candidatus Aminicenantes bacterium ADurb.Bin508]|nr:MAG: Bifunctional protein PyrR [Candidatus Aminicenantes bacterium ADurb.Bin508]
MKIKAKIMDSRKIAAALKRLAMEVVERNHDLKNTAIVGIRTRGVFLGERIQKMIEKSEGVTLPLGILDITLYRDDLSTVGPHPLVKGTEIPFDVSGKDIILVDDVLFSGRTVRAALDSIVDFGRPNSIQLLVLIDRGHRELPIQADYVGKILPTSRRENVELKLKETDGADEVRIVEEE